MNKKTLIPILCSFLFFCGCNSRTKQKKGLVIYTDIFPVYDFTRQIAKDKADVELIIPPGVDPHHFEITPADIIKLNSSDIFLYCGVGQTKMKNISQSLSKKVLSADICKNTKIVRLKKSAKTFEEKYRGHFDLTGVDPHVWLDFGNASKMAGNIYEIMTEKDAGNQSFYGKNTSNLQNEIKKLEKKYDEILSDCKITSLVHLGHFSFGYIAKKYDLQYLTLQGLTPASEPSTREVFELIRFIEQNKDIEYIFSDIFLNPRFAHAIAKQTSTKILKLNPMGNILPSDFHKSYAEISAENLSNLRKGLKCK